MDLTALTNKELAQHHADVKAEIADRMLLLQEALDPPKGPGRPKTNGTLKLRAADLEPADTDS